MKHYVSFAQNSNLWAVQGFDWFLKSEVIYLAEKMIWTS